MKISNETKVGALTAVAITLLILGFNFLKGKTLFKTGNFIYAKYTDTKGIMVSNGVFINGFQVGSVYDIENADKNLSAIVVAIKLKDNYNIPANSIASIKENPLGNASITIALGDAATYVKSGDTILTASNAGLLGDVMNKLGPVGDQIKNTVGSLDSVLKNINTIFDPATKNNLQEVIANINKTTASLVVSSASIQAMLNQQTGAITASMNNVNSFTKNLADNNDKVTRMLGNVEKTTENLSKADIDGTIAQLKNSIETLNTILGKMSSTDGSLGKLLNDKALYDNLTNTVRSANILMDDLRVHPKRYVNISVFGKKDKTGPLMAPLDSTKGKQ
ncbi:MAG: mammalian cell entry protein [Sediminibacterium sp. Gen4]|jgi:phospholipid/cholesterol/gamma-HCH transport system substrate-binding protein|uniref:MlaD family protein n=1 Tax=unclassified Sediminibacterium TaxID=2635961 RepID=UPI0015BCBB63|nr:MULTISPECIES: MlaD family protein [unclassified Sediminibacterium]MBW0161284.1 mammalian cell entry protein [Sediminibacterium sp.]MBW0164149.1 mammalian cell entry protein [Sediminibacterium sp.]NWK66688.1 mammalian cell entry protein [Sediminibacterium sp. Gen4]